MLVLETDRERHRLCRRNRIGRLGNYDRKMLAGLDPPGRVALHRAVPGDRARQDQLLEAAARHFRQMALQDPVEALPGIFGIAADLDAAPRGLRGDRRVTLRHRSCQLSSVRCAC